MYLCVAVALFYLMIYINQIKSATAPNEKGAEAPWIMNFFFVLDVRSEEFDSDVY